MFRQFEDWIQKFRRSIESHSSDVRLEGPFGEEQVSFSRMHGDSFRLLDSVPNERFAETAVELADSDGSLLSVEHVQLPSDPVHCNPFSSVDVVSEDGLVRREWRIHLIKVDSQQSQLSLVDQVSLLFGEVNVKRHNIVESLSCHFILVSVQ